MTRGREITAEERARLIAEGPQVFETHGVINHERAVFARTVGEHVAGSREPLFSSMQPRVKCRDAQAWRHAYSFALAFLKYHRADETAQAIDMEFERAGIADRPEVLEDECPGTPEEFDGLLHFIPDSDDDFQARVSQSDAPAAHAVGAAGGGAFLTQPARAPRADEEEEYAYEEYDPPLLAESGVQPEPLATGSPHADDSTNVGLHSSADLKLDFESEGTPVKRALSVHSDSGIDIQLSAFDVESDED
jgi:hypothetical protein